MRLAHPGPYDHLDVLVEQGPEVREERRQALEREVERRIREALSFRAIVELVPPGSIARTAMGKAMRVVRTY